MIPASFDYKRASSVAEALDILKGDGDAKILAGGHSLIPAMKLRLSQPSVLVDIAKIPELNFIRDRGKYFAIGAATTHGAVAAHKSVNAKLWWVANAASMIGDVQVRNAGTIGGAIAHADPASDWPAVLLAANASIKVEGTNGSRVIAAQDFFTGFFMTALEEGEIITEIHIPDPTSSDTPDSWRSTYQKFAQPASRFAIVGCAVNLQLSADGTIEQAYVAFNGVDSKAYRATSVEEALVGRTLSDETAAGACDGATAQAELIMSDHYADEVYREHLAKVICKRAISACMYD
ncbi:MAG: xanthine dehydrogenase family protein subunit M [Saprospiraceae bacterium]|nr:xanthine dehydrogenase family protein subunit M [Saprospiraceae bacterium]